MVVSFFNRHKQNIVYGLSMAVLLLIMRWLEVRLLILHHSFEIYAGIIAVLFTALGIWLALKLGRPQTQNLITPNPALPPAIMPLVSNEKLRAELNLSRREIEVLRLMAEGMSNQEIAGRLFVSLNTIKTHSSRLFEKLEVKRRTQAVDKARRLGLIG